MGLVPNIKETYEKITGIIDEKDYNIVINDLPSEKLQETAEISEIAIRGEFFGATLLKCPTILGIFRAQGIKGSYLWAVKVFLQLEEKNYYLYRILIGQLKILILPDKGSDLKKEIIAGILLSLIAFLGYSGYDVIPIIIIIGMGTFLYFLLEKKGVLGNHSFGVAVNNNDVGFDEIGGQNPAKQEIQEALEFMRQLDKFKSMGIRPIKGILLTGPPGTGKTLLAKASATYTDSVFITASGSEFIEMYAGVGAQRVRSLFQSAKKQAKKLKKKSAVIFIDEIEVIGGKRGSHSAI